MYQFIKTLKHEDLDKMIKILKKSKNDELQKLIYEATKDNNIYLLKKFGCNEIVTEKVNDIFIESIKKNDIEVVRELINKENITLKIKCENIRQYITKSRSKKGGKRGIRKRSIRKGRRRRITIFNDLIYTKSGWIELIEYCYYTCKLNIVEILLNKWKEINGINSSHLRNQYLFHKTFDIDNEYEAVQMLLKYGYDPRIKKKNRTILDLYLECDRDNYEPIMLILLKNFNHNNYVISELIYNHSPMKIKRRIQNIYPKRNKLPKALNIVYLIDRLIFKGYFRALIYLLINYKYCKIVLRGCDKLIMLIFSEPDIHTSLGIEIVQTLYNLGYREHYIKKFKTHFAPIIQNKYNNVFKFLYNHLKKNSDEQTIEKYNRNIVCDAISYGNMDIFKYFMESEFKLDTELFDISIIKMYLLCRCKSLEHFVSNILNFFDTIIELNINTEFIANSDVICKLILRSLPKNKDKFIFYRYKEHSDEEYSEESEKTEGEYSEDTEGEYSDERELIDIEDEEAESIDTCKIHIYQSDMQMIYELLKLLILHNYRIKKRYNVKNELELFIELLLQSSFRYYDYVCRILLLMLDNGGYIRLPIKRLKQLYPMLIKMRYKHNEIVEKFFKSWKSLIFNGNNFIDLTQQSNNKIVTIFKSIISKPLTLKDICIRLVTNKNMLEYYLRTNLNRDIMTDIYTVI